MDDEHAVFILVHVECPAPLALAGLLVLGVAIHPAPAAHEPLDLGRGAALAELEQALFRLRRGDARYRPDLGVRDLTPRVRLGQQREIAERARHADALASGAAVEAEAPREPFGARASALIGPAASGVELADEIQQPRVGDFEMCRQHRDLIAQPLELVALRVGMRCVHVREQRFFADVDGQAPGCHEPTLTPGFRRPWEARRSVIPPPFTLLAKSAASSRLRALTASTLAM